MERTITDAYGLFKLITGEEIIAEYEDGTAVFTLTAPRLVIPRRDEKGNIGVVLGPWFFSAQDDTFIMDKRHVLAFTSDVEKGLSDAYIANTTNLQIVSNLAGLKG